MPDDYRDERVFDQYVEINDPSDSVIKYETNGIASQGELEKRLHALIENHAVKFKGSLARFLEERFVEVSFFPEWTGERKLVVVKGINGSYIASADARHGKGGRAERLRPGMAMLEIAGYEYAIELKENKQYEPTEEELADVDEACTSFLASRGLLNPSEAGKPADSVPPVTSKGTKSILGWLKGKEPEE